MVSIEKIRDISMGLYDVVPIRECTSLKGLGLVQHPYVNSMIWYDGEELKDLNSKKNAYECREYHRNAIYKADLAALFLMVRNPYKLTWFNLCKDYLTKQEYAEYLKAAWTLEENPNQDVNVSRRKALALFRRAEKLKLMDEEEYSHYEKLPQKIMVWRGVSPGRARLGLSWTDDKDVASWFMKRFERENKKGCLLEATIDKKNVLAYFNTRGEKELIVDVFQINANIREG